MAHGGGGRLTHQLIEDVFAKAFSNPILDTRHDSARFTVPAGRLAMTTDSYVAHPILFPGGDIGSMAVFGTVNDLAMSGARPLYLTCGFIIQEGMPMEILKQIVLSMRNAAERCAVQIIAGDTKVVETRGEGGLFINTAGIGVIESAANIEPRSVRPGDMILLSGDIGRHGIAVMSAREGLEFQGPVESDSAPLAAAVQQLIGAGVALHCLRDPTRGGLATALLEIAATRGVDIQLQESQIGIGEGVRGACEILGLDPLYVANEGRFVAFVPPQHVSTALAVLRGLPGGEAAAVIGRVDTGRGRVMLRNALGFCRELDLPRGEQLPRIC